MYVVHFTRYNRLCTEVRLIGYSYLNRGDGRRAELAAGKKSLPAISERSKTQTDTPP